MYLAYFLSYANKNTMMNRIKKLLLVLTIPFVTAFSVFAVEIPEEIISGFSSGDATEIANHFKNTVELSINGKEEVYSSTQAELILKDFFKNNTSTGFEIIHKGGQGASKYAIGKLSTANSKYRVTLLIKTADSKPYIHQLRIEKDGV